VDCVLLLPPTKLHLQSPCATLKRFDEEPYWVLEVTISVTTSGMHIDGGEDATVFVVVVAGNDVPRHHHHYDTQAPRGRDLQRLLVGG
jgi:hypothetical protein